MALANTMINAAPVTTEELLGKQQSGKKTSLAPEDGTVFVEKNTSQLGYERTWRRISNFNIEANGNMNSLEVQQDSYGMRSHTAGFMLVFDLNLYGNEDDCSCPANLFPFVAFNTMRMRIGINQAEIVSPSEHYIHKFLNILNSNFSEQDKINILAGALCFPDFDLSQPKHRLMMARACGFHFDGTQVRNIKRKISVLVPLTLMHRMFNHETILPVGTRLDFQFNIDGDGNPDAIVKRDGDITSYYKFLPQQSYLFAEYPERDPAILLSQVDNREYISEGLDYETYRIDLAKGSTYYSLPILRPGSKLPVKIDFGLIPQDVFRKGKDIFQFKGMGVTKINCIYNGPFPTMYQLYSISGAPNDEWTNNDEDHYNLDKLPFFQQFYNQTDTFLIDKEGESYNNEMTFTPMKRINPIAGYVAEHGFFPFDDKTYESMIKLHNNRQVYTFILQPSQILDGSAYPTVEGSIDFVLHFAKQLKENCVLIINCNYYQQIALLNNFQCEIRSITLQNFVGTDPIHDPELPTPSNLTDSLPLGEADNLME